MRPIIAIPMGDPSGIGPEIIMKALKNPEIYRYSKPLVVGNLRLFERINKIINSGLVFRVIKEPADVSGVDGTVDMINVDLNESEKTEGIVPGSISAEAGEIAYKCIETTVDLAISKSVHAIATTPINKEAIKAAGILDIGHTEMLERLTGSKDPLTMFQVHELRVFFLTRHVSLEKACELVTKERLMEYSRRCIQALKMLGVEHPRLAIAGLNPHCGEHGLFGDEEVREIEPAVKALQYEGYDVVGPLPADSVFYQALKGKFHAVLSLYHDQGHIATKMVDFEKTISLTIGMPFLRTSVDHGTAFDIAWKGIASSISMEEAIRLAAKYAGNYSC